MNKILVSLISFFLLLDNHLLHGANPSKHHLFQGDSIPQVTISSSSGDSSATTPISTRISFSEPVYGFEKSDIEVTNGFITSFKATVEHKATLGPDLASMEYFLKYQKGLALDSANQLYIADTDNHRIRIFDNSHRLFATLGTAEAGNGNDQFNKPYGVGFGPDGKLYVADYENYRIQVFDKNLKYFATIGSGIRGSGDNDFLGPTNVTVSKEGIVYVADSPNNRIQVFDQNFKYLTTLGSTEGGTDPGQFRYPMGMAVDSIGNLYVVDRYNYRVQIFSKELNYLSSIGGNGRGSADDQFDNASSVAIDAEGNIYVCDENNHDIRIFDQNHNLIDKIGTTGSAGLQDGQFRFPIAVAISSVGKVYVADPDNDRIQIFDQHYNYESKFGVGSTGTGNDRFNSPTSVATDKAGNLYVVDQNNHRVQIYDQNLNYLATIGGNGDGMANSQLRHPIDVTVDHEVRILVADQGNRRIQIFNHLYEYQATLETPDWYSTEDKEWYSPAAVATNAKGEIFIVDSWNHRVLIYDKALNYKTSIGTGEQGSGEYTLSNPADVAIDAKGNVYIADRYNQRIQIFDSTYQYHASITNVFAFGEYIFESVTGVAVDSLGNIFVADQSNPRIQVFNKDLKHVATIGTGTQGINTGQFKSPRQVAVDTEGNIFVADLYNHHIQQFFPLTSYTFDIFPEKEGAVDVSVLANIASNMSGHGNETSSALQINYDASPSTYMYVSSDATATHESFEVRIIFSEKVSSFSSGDIQVINGTVASLTTSDSIFFTAKITPTGQDTIILNLADEVAFDNAGNGNQAAAPISFARDSQRPFFLMTSPEHDPTSNPLIPIRGVFNEPVEALSIADFEVTNGVITSLSKGKPAYKATIGTDLQNLENYLGSPGGIAFDQQNNLYVTSRRANLIKIYDEKLNYFTSLGDGSVGNGRYQFNTILDIALDAQGKIYVVDMDNDRIQIYNKDRKYEATLGTGIAGTGKDEFDSPTSIAIDKQGRILVVDRDNHRVQVFDNNLKYLATIGTTGVAGAENNQFSHPAQVSVGPDGTIYIADPSNKRVQLFNSNLEYVTSIVPSDNSDTPDHQFFTPIDVTVDSKGNIFIVDLHNTRILQFDMDRNYISKIEGYYSYNFPRLSVPLNLATDAQDQLFIVDTKFIHVFDQSLNQVAFLGDDGSGDGNNQFYEPAAVHVDKNQKVYVADRLNHRVQIFDKHQNYLATLSGDIWGFAEDKFQTPSDIAVDDMGNIYVADEYDKHRILIYDKSLNFIGRLGDGTPGSGNKQLASPIAITLDKTGNIYVVDRWNHRIQIFDRNREYLATIGSGVAGSENDQFNNPSDIAVDLQGNIFVADPYNYRIQIFDKDRNYKTTLSGNPSVDSDDSLMSPWHLNLDQVGNLYVLDQHKLKVFDTALNHLYTFGSAGIRQEHFNNPSDVAIGSDGTIYVADRQNHRVQLFTSSSTYHLTVSPLQDGLVKVKLPADVISDDSGNGNDEAHFTINYDSSKPTVVLSSAVDPRIKEPEIPIAISFNEAVHGFDVSALMLGNATASPLVTSDSIVFTTNLMALQQGTISVQLLGEKVKDDAGNGNKASNRLTFYYDLNSPTVQLSSSEQDTTSLQTFPVAITFSEFVSGFSTSDLQVSNATVTSLTTEDSTTFVSEVTALDEGEIIIQILSDVAQDRMGYGNTAALPFTIVYQKADSTEMPTEPVEPEPADEETALQALLNTSSDTVSGEFTVEISFNRAVKNFSLSEVTVNNGHASSLLTSDSTTFELLVTPSEVGEVQISLSEAFTHFNRLIVIYEQEEVTGVMENGLEHLLKVYPIPVQDVITIEMSLPNSTSVIVTLSTLEGKTVYEKIFHNTKFIHETIDVTQLPRGTYLATLDCNGERVFHKVIKY